ncbi:uncharacterized protein LOC143434980 isoform X2 [Arvicanthis niloticus]|uniref:uncharacterized protein LOC143309311 isoform X2 n=1 Tax=Arvicanthis niloticus TaxID=61156 RepID=UPI00402B543E
MLWKRDPVVCIDTSSLSVWKRGGTALKSPASFRSSTSSMARNQGQAGGLVAALTFLTSLSYADLCILAIPTLGLKSPHPHCNLGLWFISPFILCRTKILKISSAWLRQKSLWLGGPGSGCTTGWVVALLLLGTWVDESKRTPLLISQVPAKSRRTYLSTEVKNTYNTHKTCRNSHLPLAQIKYQTEELDSIRRELSKIKAQVDSLLESLESMEQQRDQHVKNQASDQYSQ